MIKQGFSYAYVLIYRSLYPYLRQVSKGFSLVSEICFYCKICCILSNRKKTVLDVGIERWKDGLRLFESRLMPV